MRHRLTAAVLTAAALALTACTAADTTAADKPTKTASSPAHKTAKKTPPDKLDEPGQFACDDFAKDYKAATSQTARLDLAHKVNKWAPSSKTDRIADMGHVLANGAAGSDSSWQIAADSFAQACLDAGWKA